MGLAHLLLEFFNDGRLSGSILYPYSLLDFVKKYPEWGPQIHKMASYSRKLENEYLLNHMGTTPGPNPYYVHHYYTNKAIYQKELSAYGSYDLLVEGFLSVRDKFYPLVLPVSVMKENGDFSLGSSFVYTENLVITARHCIEGLKKIDLLDKDGNIIAINRVYFPTDDRIDVAVLELKDPLFNKFPTISLPFREEWEGTGEMDELNFIGEKSITVFAPGKILDDVLTLGYPPISGFESILIADKSSINSQYFRTSHGQILGAEPKYTDTIEYLLLNARVKGGNSGGPVIDRLGRIVGMIVQMPQEIQNPKEIDKLGYGLAIPSKYIKQLISGIKNADGSTIEKKVTQLGENSFNVL